MGHLLTPGNGNSIEALTKTGLPIGVDNGAFGIFDPMAFRRLLKKVKGQPILWIACPDKVTEARETTRLFEEWKNEVAEAGPVAFVGQDGQEDLETPWIEFDCLFVGGSTKWKLSVHAGDLMQEAKKRGKLVHVGRVNSLRRIDFALDAGADSIDGSCFSRWSNVFLERALKFINVCSKQPKLF